MSIEQLNLTCNKQTNFNKLGPLSRIFQIVLRSKGNGKFSLWDFSIGWLEYDNEWFWPLKPFSKLKTTFCKYWTFIKINISMTCIYEDYEGKIRIVQEQWLQLKWSFYWVITWTFLFCAKGEMILWCVGIKIWSRSLLGGGDFSWWKGGWLYFWPVEEELPPSPQ